MAVLAALLVLFSVALTMRLYVLLADPTPTGDSATRYYPLAVNILSGHGFTKDLKPPYRPDSFDVPGYPLMVAGILWATLGDKQGIAVVQLMLELGTLLALSRLAAQLKLPRHVQTVAVVLGLLCPFLPFWAARMMTEVVATLLATLLCYSLLRAIDSETRHRLVWWCCAGLVLGASLLMRPDMVLAGTLMVLVASIVAWHGDRRQRRRTTAGLAVCGVTVALVLAPWTLYAYQLFGTIQPLGRIGDQRTNGYATWLSTWADNTSYSKPYWWDLLKPEGPASFTSWRLAPDEKAEATALLKIARKQGTVEGEVSDRFMALAVAHRRRVPLESQLVIPWHRVVNTWLNMPDYTPVRALPGFASTPDGSATPVQLRATRVLHSVWTPLLLFGLIGSCWSLTLRPRGVAILFALMLGRSALPFISGLAVEPRYVVESLPVCFILSALGIEAVGVAVWTLARRLPGVGQKLESLVPQPAPPVARWRRHRHPSRITTTLLRSRRRIAPMPPARAAASRRVPSGVGSVARPNQVDVTYGAETAGPPPRHRRRGARAVSVGKYDWLKARCPRYYETLGSGPAVTTRDRRRQELLSRDSSVETPLTAVQPALLASFEPVSRRPHGASVARRVVRRRKYKESQ